MELVGLEFDLLDEGLEVQSASSRRGFTAAGRLSTPRGQPANGMLDTYTRNDYVIDMPISGIYAIKCNGRMYIGRAANLGARWAGHLTSLAQGKHHNKSLQADFDKYGTGEFSFSVLEVCPAERLEERERAHIWHRRKEGNYNIRIIPTRALLQPDPIEIDQSYKKRYRNLRLLLDLTQVELASILGIAQASVSDRERGAVEVSREHLMALLYLKTLPRAELDALLADPSKLED